MHEKYMKGNRQVFTAVRSGLVNPHKLHHVYFKDVRTETGRLVLSKMFINKLQQSHMITAIEQVSVGGILKFEAELRECEGFALGWKVLYPLPIKH